jgi:hypothetical protein
MTKAAKHFGKTLENWMRAPSTIEYIEALSVQFTGKPVVHVIRGGGQYPTTGTWAHPKLAVFFARWLDVRFAVWCDAVIDELIRCPRQDPFKGPATPMPERRPLRIPRFGESLIQSTRYACRPPLNPAFSYTGSRHGPFLGPMVNDCSRMNPTSS